MTAGFDRGGSRSELERLGVPDPYNGDPPAMPQARYQAPSTTAAVQDPATFQDPPAPRPAASTADVAADQAGAVADSATDAGRQVVQTTKEQVGEVTAEAGRQARQLLDQVQTEVTDQAATQQRRVAEGIRQLAQELSSMVSGSQQDGPATDLARQAADRAEGIARWLEDREPGDVLAQVRSFARRRPGTYLAIAAGAGILAGRLTRGLTADDGRSAPGPSGRTIEPAVPLSPPDGFPHPARPLESPPVVTFDSPASTAGLAPGYGPTATGPADVPTSGGGSLRGGLTR